MRPEAVDFVLVRPSRGANVAAACRALKNMGFGPPVVVQPVPADLDRQARGLAYGAWDLLDAARMTASLREAVRGSTLVAAATARPHPAAWAPRRLAEEARRSPGRLAVVFGPEASGLSGVELDLCPVHVRIPSSDAQPSLNLAQAVLVIAYELRLALQEAGEQAGPAPATAGEIEAALDHLKRALLAIGYLNPQNPEAVLSELRRLLARAAPSSREVLLLHGLARQISWSAENRGDGRGEGR